MQYIYTFAYQLYFINIVKYKRKLKIDYFLKQYLSVPGVSLDQIKSNSYIATFSFYPRMT
jgi:hypothetical protein